MGGMGTALAAPSEVGEARRSSGLPGGEVLSCFGFAVGRVQIQNGIDCEPLLLNVLYLATSSEREECQQLVKSPYVFPCNAKVGTVFTAFTVPAGIILINNAESSGDKGWTAIPKEDMNKIFRDLLAKQEKWFTSMNEINWLQVKNLCQL
ncbi:ubiquitin carboxyl-terminal hydrolase 40-like [Tamandua tetradactyla]|uniref:ubiquitin carboxyl-terminal hydrolase 40-like n=1 Tax=Tamandua tetradactyla TaxID=48850 RepID=UPI0040538B9C